MKKFLLLIGLLGSLCFAMDYTPKMKHSFKENKEQMQRINSLKGKTFSQEIEVILADKKTMQGFEEAIQKKFNGAFNYDEFMKDIREVAANLDSAYEDEPNLISPYFSLSRKVKTKYGKEETYLRVMAFCIGNKACAKAMKEHPIDQEKIKLLAKRAESSAMGRLQEIAFDNYNNHFDYVRTGIGVTLYFLLVDYYVYQRLQ